MNPMQQNPDGSWSEVIPLGWQGSGTDWEVCPPGSAGSRAAGVRWLARGYDEDVLVAQVYARTRAGLNRKMRKFGGDQ